MRNYLLITALTLAGSQSARAQAAPAPRYMQIFYEGAGWLAGRPLLHYSPALRGKTTETVTEPDSTRSVSPNAFAYEELPKETITTVGKDGHEIVYTRGQDGKMVLQPPTTKQQEQAQRERFFSLLTTRAALAQNALTMALNAAATDGWEVVQVASWGSKDGLVYLLRRR